MFKVNNKNTRPRYETCLKLELKNKYQNNTIKQFLPGSSVFIVDFEDVQS